MTSLPLWGKIPKSSKSQNLAYTKVCKILAFSISIKKKSFKKVESNLLKKSQQNVNSKIRAYTWVRERQEAMNKQKKKFRNLGAKNKPPFLLSTLHK